MSTTADRHAAPLPPGRALDLAEGAAPEAVRRSVGIITLAVALFALFGPLFAPYGENEVVGPPYSSQGVFGTDYLGQDVLSRLMYGGTEVLVIALLATVLSTVLGTLIGVVAAYGGGWWDEVIMRLNDVLLSFPQILLALVVLTSIAQPKAWMLVVLVGLSQRSPRPPGSPAASRSGSSPATSCTPPRRSARGARG